MKRRQQLRLIIAGGIVLLIALLVYGLFVVQRNATKTVVELKAFPEDSKITMNNQPVNPGTLYLKPGKYTFKATREGFNDTTQTITVGQEDTSLTLIPQADEDPSPAAREWLKTHPEEASRREGEIGRQVQRESEEFAAKNPIIGHLPLPYGQMRFSIDYEETDKSPTGVNVIIIADDATARGYALDQIREWSIDPSDLMITFEDYTNPLGSGSEAQ